jgi:hypothetical protein
MIMKEIEDVIYIYKDEEERERNEERFFLRR